MMHCYIRADSGCLNRVDLVVLDGMVFVGPANSPTTLTWAGETRLQGWGLDDGMTDVWANPAGREIIVPRRFRSRAFLEAIGYYVFDDDDAIELVTTSELLRRLGVPVSAVPFVMRALRLEESLWSHEALAELASGG